MATIRKRHGDGRLVGYARVSTEEQGTDAQIDELRAAGCETIHQEHASGADRGRPVLAGLLNDIQMGETLVVVRLDRLARSVSHLLKVIERLEQKGVSFPFPPRPRRYDNAAGDVFVAGAWCRRAARARSDFRAHEGGSASGQGAGAPRRQSGAARP